jgi:fatty acid desaturase
MRDIRVEWLTILLIAACYGAIVVSTTYLTDISTFLGVIALGISLTLYSSLQHEVLHGHPTPSRHLNETFVFPSFFLIIPFQRFRDTHLAHHQDANLTDPYDDPETNYLDPAVWERLPQALRTVLIFNNTLFGRVTIGAAIGGVSFLTTEWRLAKSDVMVRKAWALHALGLIPVIWLISVTPISFFGILVANYIAMSLLRIRTFLEHQAHEKSRARTVIIESRGPLAFLFLNNNFHAVHHMHPKVAWYDLPKLYRDNKARYLKVNGGYVYGCYLHVAKAYLVKAKDAVAHPLWRKS